MLIKILGCVVIAGLISSCSVKESIDDDIYHYKKLTRNQSITKEVYSKDTNILEGMRFLVANQPDQKLIINGDDFDERYTKLVEYLKNNGFTVKVSEKLPMTATIIAEVDKPMPDMRYIAIAMEQDSRMNQTEYSVVYGSNKFLAHKLYEGYKKSLESTKKDKTSEGTVKKNTENDAKTSS
jgi:hypothetical protein